MTAARSIFRKTTSMSWPYVNEKKSLGYCLVAIALLLPDLWLQTLNLIRPLHCKFKQQIVDTHFMKKQKLYLLVASPSNQHHFSPVWIELQPCPNLHQTAYDCLLSYCPCLLCNGMKCGDEALVEELYKTAA